MPLPSTFLYHFHLLFMPVLSLFTPFPPLLTPFASLFNTISILFFVPLPFLSYATSIPVLCHFHPFFLHFHPFSYHFHPSFLPAPSIFAPAPSLSHPFHAGAAASPALTLNHTKTPAITALLAAHPPVDSKAAGERIYFGLLHPRCMQPQLLADALMA